MRKSNKSLNDLFRSAQAEADGNVLSQSEVERLLQPIKRSVPVTQFIKQKLFERLLSTPLKIGMTAMTTAACITLGLIAFWPQQSTNTITKAPILSHRTYASEGTVEATQNISQPTANNATFVAANNQAVVATAIIPATPIATADSLQPVELTPEQLAQLGIVLEDNGDIDFYTKNGDQINKFGLMPTWGVRMQLGEKFTKADTEGIVISKSAPRLITEPDGAKRFFSFESDSSITLKDGNKAMMMHIQNQTRIAPGISSKNSDQPHRFMIRMSGGSGNESNMEVSDASDTLPKDIHTTVLTNVKVAVDDSSVNNNLLKGMGSVNLDSIIASLNLDSILASMNFDSIVRSAHPELHGKSLDSAIQEAHNASINVKKIMSSMQFHLDTSSKPSNPSLNIEINTNDDNQPGAPTPPMKEVEDAANTIDLAKLIPIRIRNMKNAAHPNELIFWYEPSPELTAAMPAAVNATPAPQTKQLAISVYPNPTFGPATVHYELSDAPRAYFSVRNLLGQEVLNGGMTSGITGDANLDLSQLPAGVYLLVTTTDNGERDVERVVVAK